MVGDNRFEPLTSSTDGQWVAFQSSGKQEDIFLTRTDGAGIRQLTDDPDKDRKPQWSPDGKQIAFFSDRSGKFQIWTIHLAGCFSPVGGSST